MATVYSNHCCLESWLWTSKLSVSLFFTQPCTYFLAICLSRTLFFWFKLFVSSRFYSATLQIYRDSPLYILFVNLLGCHSVLLMHFVHPLYTFLKVPTPNLFTVQACFWSNQEIVTDISLLMQNHLLTITSDCHGLELLSSHSLCRPTDFQLRYNLVACIELVSSTVSW